MCFKLTFCRASAIAGYVWKIAFQETDAENQEYINILSILGPNNFII